MERIIMHIDVNSAFLSWTAVYLISTGFKSDIRCEYSVIGGSERDRKGIVLAKSQLAKKAGILTAETIYSAKRKCPNLKVYPPNFDYYNEMSNSLFSLLTKYTSDIEIASIDECYLDYTKVKNIYGNEIEFAYRIKDEIKNKLGFTVNIGIANNKLCAKMASDFTKPDKVHTLYMNEIKEKMFPLKVGELFGVGKQTAFKLNTIGIYTIKDLATADESILKKNFKNTAASLISWANGVDESKVCSDIFSPKGISNEITLPYNTSNKEYIKKQIILLCDNLSTRLRKEKKFCKTVTIIIKDDKFKRFSHQKTIKNRSDVTKELTHMALECFEEINNLPKVRLIGVRFDNLSDSKITQLSIFEHDNYINSDKLDKALDQLKNKYGSNIIKPAINFETKE